MEKRSSEFVTLEVQLRGSALDMCPELRFKTARVKSEDLY